ncbi:hypothetical protein PV08_04740 [Exophiala spinifera]|uniref:Xylanolytic transcriptional activator regulatory domain-containing protein n=1 Tax=Exophiala spinifera TaxID=91928 RepID=A0A0D1YQR8_9EURO|nr:uncharacterized protein PV08_04740 [Exophiala spinifera]KIW17546.1 hypothetical protein PV08_04740 [Exophiala spinifera]
MSGLPESQDMRPAESMKQTQGILDEICPDPSRMNSIITSSVTDSINDATSADLTVGAMVSPEAFESHVPSYLFAHSLDTLDATDFNSNLDWLFDNLPGEESAHFVDSFGERDFKFPSVPLGDAPGAQSPRPNLTADHHLLEKANTPSVQGANDLDLPYPGPQDSCGPDDPWPMEWHAEPSQPIVDLPSLGCDEDENPHLYPRFFSNASLHPSTVEALAHHLRLPASRSPWQSSNLDRFPDKAKLDYCIDRYFAQFHQLFPFIHQPTFDPAKDLTVTLAIASIGALYTQLSEAVSFSNALSELNRRLLLFLAEYDRRYVRTEAYLTAQLLQGLHGYYSGNKRLFELSESFRNNLVHHAKCMGLFRYKPEPNMTSATSQKLEERWKNWIREEKLRRLGWAVYEYDASVAYLHNNRPFLSIGEVHTNLPCMANYWSAESAHAWAAMLQPTVSDPVSPRLETLIRVFFDGTRKPEEKVQDERHRYIIVSTLCRMIWTLKEIRSSPVVDLVPYGPQNTTEILVAAADKLSRCPQTLAATLTTAELAHAMHTLQVVYVTHLYGAGGLMNWLYPLLRDDYLATTTFTSLDHWAKQNPRVAREAAFYSARILAIARIYPSNSPNEPAMIFHAGTVLYFLAKVLPTNFGTDRAAVWLDQLSPGDDGPPSPVKQWISHGESSIVCMHGVPSLLSEQGGKHILDQTAELLKRRRVWGIADSFFKVVLRLRDRTKKSLE